MQMSPLCKMACFMFVCVCMCLREHVGFPTPSSYVQIMTQNLKRQNGGYREDINTEILGQVMSLDCQDRKSFETTSVG